MKIKTATYEGLTPEQRFRAAVSALARDDDGEIDQLRKSCPLRTFSITDPGYSGRMEAFLRLSSFVEMELRGDALVFFMGLFKGRNDADPIGKAEERVAGSFASLLAGWRKFLDAVELDHDEADRAGRQQHPAVIYLSKRWEGQADPDLVAEYFEHFCKTFASAAA